MPLPLYSQNDDWKAFYRDEAEQRYLEETIVEEWIDSGDTQIHLDIYECSRNAPTVIYCHGLSSCGRMMGYMVRHIYEKGYNVICPDLIGFGMTTKKHGSGTIDQYIQNLLDVIAYTKEYFDGPRFLTGISLGGGLTYYAAAAGADVNAIACLCLMDFSAARVHKRASFHHLIKSLFKGAALVAPQLSIPMKHFLSLDNLCPDPEIVQIFKSNPLVIKTYTLRSLYSLVTSRPKIPFEEFDRVPVMVLHAEEDRLLPEHMSKRNYDRLPGKKEYMSLKNCAHIPIDPPVIENYVEALDGWFRQYGDAS